MVIRTVLAIVTFILMTVPKCCCFNKHQLTVSNNKTANKRLLSRLFAVLIFRTVKPFFKGFTKETESRCKYICTVGNLIQVKIYSQTRSSVPVANKLMNSSMEK